MTAKERSKLRYRVKRAMKKLEKSIQKAKPNMDKIESVDDFMKEMREL